MIQPLSYVLTSYSYSPSAKPSTHFLQNFVPRLKDHCIARLTDLELASEDLAYTDQDRDKLVIYNDTLYQHSTAQFNFTTYDLQRDRDVINTNTAKCDIIVASREDDVEGRHPFWYARVLSVFHVRVSHGPTKSERKRIEVLFVRWFGMDPDWEGGHDSCRLDRVGFVPFEGDEDGPAFGFLDPATVVRGCHMIPSFVEGKTMNLLPPSRFRDSDGDYVNYYVNKYVLSLTHLSRGSFQLSLQIRYTRYHYAVHWIRSGSCRFGGASEHGLARTRSKYIGNNSGRSY